MTDALNTIAYFSMEVGIKSEMPTYSGGLGVLAGDTVKASADLGIPMVVVTLLYRQGYFRQHLDATGNQTETSYIWPPERLLEPLDPRVATAIEGRTVAIRAWRYTVAGIRGASVPVYFLDTDLEGNDPRDREICGRLYGGDQRYRLMQEAVLGLGGVAMLRALGHEKIHVYHMNEGHSALLTVALLEEGLSPEDVREKCVFTTHTPVQAGHDRFSSSLAASVLGGDRWKRIEGQGGDDPEELNMTSLALSLSRYVNGVAMRHGEVAQTMFPEYPIDSITNGVHAATWTSPSFAALYDVHIPHWRMDNAYLRHAIRIPYAELRTAHAEAKKILFETVRKKTGVTLDPSIMTIGFARRATAYKRPDLLFSDLDRLMGVVGKAGRLQIVYAGKAHPHDESGKDLIRRIFHAAEVLKNVVPIVYLEEYDMSLAKKLCAGVDLWLNTPQKPQEASGTSGMKAAMNGVPSLSVLDGWWIEGHIEGVTGWSIGEHWDIEESLSTEADSLYDKLENKIIPLYYGHPAEFEAVMRSTIALNGSFFSAQRMMSQYLKNAYLHD